MKRITALFLLLALLLCGCHQEKKPQYDMYIESAQLTEEEAAIADLLGADAKQPIFDFHVDDTVQRIEVNVYELKNGQWDMFYGGGGSQLQDAEGRIALQFDVIFNDLRVAIQSENCKSSTSFKSAEPVDAKGMSIAASLLSGKKELKYEEEICLALQVLTTAHEFRSFDPDSFHTPEAFAPYHYDHVYAVTVKFSQIPLGEME